MPALDILVSFDTTGSMYPCLAQVRREVSALVRRMSTMLPDIRVAVAAHGDYCDAGSTYVTKLFDFSKDMDAVCRFVSDVGPTGGGDSPECYELVLHEARSLSWGAGREKILVMIGDDVPHGVDYRQNVKRLDWRNELKLLVEAGVKVYGVHAMPGIRRHSKPFYTQMAEITGGLYLTLDQFEYVGDMLLGVVAQQSGGDTLAAFEEEVRRAGRMNRSKQVVFDTLAGRAPRTGRAAPSVSSTSVGDLVPVPAGRFQVIPVGGSDIPIKDCVLANGASFRTGRGFYEWTKSEEVQEYKEVVLQDRATGDFFSGDEARRLAGLPIGTRTTSRPPPLDRYRAFIQSTSANRKLKANTTFLYEIEDWDRPAEVAGY